MKAKPSLLEPGWTVEEVAAYLATTPGQIRNLVYEKRIPYRKVGSRLLFRRISIDAWLAGLPGVGVEAALQRCRELWGDVASNVAESSERP